jgi:hypothetical protein
MPRVRLYLQASNPHSFSRLRKRDLHICMSILAIDVVFYVYYCRVQLVLLFGLAVSLKGLEQSLRVRSIRSRRKQWKSRRIDPHGLSDHLIQQRDLIPPHLHMNVLNHRLRLLSPRPRCRNCKCGLEHNLDSISSLITCSYTYLR